MTTFAKFAAVLGVAGLSVGFGHSPASSADTGLLIVKPYKAINLASGTKRAIGYYIADAGACQLTLQLADKYSDYANTVSEPVRINMTVREGSSARFQVRCRRRFDERQAGRAYGLFRRCEVSRQAGASDGLQVDNCRQTYEGRKHTASSSFSCDLTSGIVK